MSGDVTNGVDPSKKALVRWKKPLVVAPHAPPDLTSKPTDSDEVRARLIEAHLARQALTKLEEQWSLVKEQGGSMPAAFWEVFGKAVMSVRAAERAVTEARAKARR